MTREAALKAGQEALMDTGVDAVRVRHTDGDCQECKRLAALVLDAVRYDELVADVKKLREALMSARDCPALDDSWVAHEVVADALAETDREEYR